MASPASLFRRLPFMERRSRRLAVIAAFAGYPLMILGYTFLVATGALSTVVWAPIAIALFSATIIGVVAIYGFGQGRMDRRQRLDERQRAMIDRALVASYGVVTTTVAVALGVMALHASFVGPLVIEMPTLLPFLIAAGLYEPLLPFAALAWIEPDAPADDEA